MGSRERKKSNPIILGYDPVTRKKSDVLITRCYYGLIASLFLLFLQGIMKEDERKMDEMTRRSSDLVTANNNAKLLSEMLDHFDRGTSGAEELELLKELFEACEKMQPKLFRLASDTEDGDESIAEILQTSDDISRVMDR